MVFNENSGIQSTHTKVRCGRCIGCRLDHARMWSLRCLNEASLYTDNCFLTLTYSDDYLPSHNSLVKSDLQKFNKRLRKQYGEGIRFYAAGEYGEKNQRPHYHSIVFNHSFNDIEYYDYNNGMPLYTSVSLQRLWPYGFSTVGAVTFDSVMYTARYILKKITGPRAADHYKDRVPEFSLMSRKRGIGYDFYQKYKSDFYNNDYFVVRDNFKLKPPRYYDTLYEIENTDHMQQIKANRMQYAKQATDNTFERLKTREESQEIRQSRITRKIEQ